MRLGLGLGLAACGDAANHKRPAHASATLSDKIATVVKVGWTTEEASVGYVEYGPTRERGLRAPTETVATQAHAMTLLGLTADSDCYCRAITSDGSSSIPGDIASIRTGVLPVGLPPLTQTGTGQSEFIVAPVIGKEPAL